MLLDLLRDLLHDVGVGADEIVAAHPRLAGDPGGDDDDLAPRRGAVVVGGADDARVEAFDRRRFPLVEGFSLGDAVDDVDEDDGAGEFFFGEALGSGGADIASANDGDLGEHGAGETNRPGWTGKHPSIDLGRC